MAGAAEAEVAPRCFCGATFSTIEALRDHAEQKGHRFMCSCGRLYKDRKYLHDHWASAQTGHPLPNSSENPALIGFTLAVVSTVNSQPVNAFVDGATSGPDHAGHAAHGGASSKKTTYPCGVCNKKFKTDHALKTHNVDKHKACPTCHQAFLLLKQLEGHQKAANHCYCEEHGAAFRTPDSLRVHKLSQEHITGYECLICDKAFTTQQGLDDHLMNANHPTRDTEEYSVALDKVKAAVEEANMHCEACDRFFRTINAFRQHKASIKHKPISDLNGSCKSGMNRMNVDAVVHQQDTERHITYQKNVPAVLAAAEGVVSITDRIGSMSIASHSLRGGVNFTPDATDSDTSSTCGGALLTPSQSRTVSVLSGGGVPVPTPSTTNAKPSPSSSISGGVVLTPSTLSEWSFVADVNGKTPASTSIASSNATVTQANISDHFECNICSRVFRKADQLLQHLNSPAHASKIYHCPTEITGPHVYGTPQKTFKTLSGMAQHIEAGACSGGKGMLGTIVGMFEQKLEEATGYSVKLLKGRTA